MTAERVQEGQEEDKSDYGKGARRARNIDTLHNPPPLWLSRASLASMDRTQMFELLSVHCGSSSIRISGSYGERSSRRPLVSGAKEL